MSRINPLTIYEFLDKYTYGEVPLNMNDAFHWGCSDQEKAFLRELEALRELEQTYDSEGVYAWVAVLRGMDVENLIEHQKDFNKVKYYEAKSAILGDLKKYYWWELRKQMDEYEEVFKDV